MNRLPLMIACLIAAIATTNLLGVARAGSAAGAREDLGLLARPPVITPTPKPKPPPQPEPAPKPQPMACR